MPLSATADRITVKPLLVTPPWEAFTVEVGSFPVEPTRLEPVRNAIGRLNGVIAGVTGVLPGLFLQVSQLHLDGGTSRFAAHARKWSPSMGLGIFPNGEPPRTWTLKDFEKLEPGDQLRPMCHKVFRVGAVKESDAAWNLMFGRGVTLWIYAPEIEIMLLQMRHLFLPGIEERIFRRYPFFVTLLDRRGLELASAEELDRWSCGLIAYVRESAEDHSVLIASRLPLLKIIESAGFVTSDKI
jgi:hypothetical protein